MEEERWRDEDLIYSSFLFLFSSPRLLYSICFISFLLFV